MMPVLEKAAIFKKERKNSTPEICIADNLITFSFAVETGGFW